VKRQPSDAAGEFIRNRVTGEVDGRAHVVARTRFVEAALGKRTRSGNPARIALFATTLAVALALIWGVHTFRAPMTFASGANRAPGVLSEYMVSPPSEETPLYFSDGSVVTLAPAARARVDSATANGAVLLVESGRLSANVVHRSKSEWRFLAGPYSVHVTGTAFVLGWQPAGILDIEMKSGVVVVSGPGVASGVEVRDHRRFITSVAPASSGVEVTNAWPESSTERTAPAEQPPGVPAASTRVAKASEESGPARRDVRPDTPAPPDDPWTTLVARGEYSRVLAAANARGLDSTLAMGTVEDLSALADAARFAGDRSIAERSLREIRARFPGTARSQSSAFLLGRIADDAGDARTAVSWYDRYLNEAPGGSLAADASGRRMLALRRLNDPESARRAALEYLQRFPTGSYSNIARDIAGP
jgi:TolA-binding protein